MIIVIRRVFCIIAEVGYEWLIQYDILRAIEIFPFFSQVTVVWRNLLLQGLNKML